MPRLTKIYTRKGDDGFTTLANGKRVMKNDLRITVYGTLDELNSAIGAAMATGLSPEVEDFLIEVQQELFELGAELSSPDIPEATSRITEQNIKRLEAFINKSNDRLHSLQNFLLPGGKLGSALIHLARTICRRSERLLVKLKQKESVDHNALAYLNRLSDALFVAARFENMKNNIKERLWKDFYSKQRRKQFPTSF